MVEESGKKEGCAYIDTSFMFIISG